MKLGTIPDAVPPEPLFKRSTQALLLRRFVTGLSAMGAPRSQAAPAPANSPAAPLCQGGHQ
jgi:hypothetical protein